MKSKRKVSEKFYKGYLFLIRAIQSCKTVDQYKSAAKISWVFINNNITWNSDYYNYLKLICNELDLKKEEVILT